MMNILIIEPDEYYHDKIGSKLAGFANLFIAKERKEAVSALANFQPDIIVSELVFSDGTIYEFLEDLQEIQEQNPLIIVHSRIQNFEDVQATMERGINHYLVKGQDTLEDLKNLLLSFNNNAR